MQSTNTNLARKKKSQINKQNSHKKSNVHDHRTTQTMKRNQQINKRHQNQIQANTKKTNFINTKHETQTKSIKTSTITKTTTQKAER